MHYRPEVIDDRAFLLGLDQLYRDAMHDHERHELLGCAREVAAALKITAQPVPIEGYYRTDARLTEYFRLMRALQQVRESRIPEVRSLLAYQRLCQVLSSPIFGLADYADKLLPTGRDPLSLALYATPVTNWSIPTLTAAAHEVAQASDDWSLVGLAAWLEDPVVLTALRESVILYADLVLGSLDFQQPSVGWAVTPELAERGTRFIAAFRALFGTELPAPIAKNAYAYWRAANDGDIEGRCARIGFSNQIEPVHCYHWAIDYGPVNELAARDFWHTDVWTTDRYRAAIALNERPLSAPFAESVKAH